MSATAKLAASGAMSIDWQAVRTRIVEAGKALDIPESEVGALARLSDRRLNDDREFLDFASRNAISLDWLIDGDVAPLLRNFRRSRSGNDDELFTLFSDWRQAQDRINHTEGLADDDPVWEIAQVAAARIQECRPQTAAGVAALVIADCCDGDFSVEPTTIAALRAVLEGARPDLAALATNTASQETLGIEPEGRSC